MQNQILKIYLRVHIFFVFCLIALGGAVRSMNAGLACPDWPLCFGKVIPDYQIQVYYEFIHRVLAGLETFLTLGLLVFIVSKPFDKKIKRTIIISTTLLFTQVVLGGLTVLKLLHFSIVTAHLAVAICFLCSLLWLYFQLFEPPKLNSETIPKSFQTLLFIITAMIFIQILIGGLVSSNYAGLVCEGFPLCNGMLAPTFDGLIGLQVKHRLWGYLTALAILSFVQVIWKNRNQKWMEPKIVRYGLWLTTLIIVQIVVGAMNVIFKTPPTITVVHLAIAATLIGLMLKIYFVGTKKS